MNESSVLPITVGVAERCRGALAFAAEEARRSGRELRIVHAFTVPPGPPDVLELAYGVDVDGSFRATAAAVLAEAAMAVEDGGIVVRTALEEGRAAPVLTTASASSGLLVLGPDSGDPWYTRLLSGRTSRALVRSARCPVVVVPETWDARHRSPGVTLLLDGRMTAHGPFRFAFELAARDGEVLRLVHVQDGDEPPAVWRELSRLVGAWQARYPMVRTDVRLVSGTADVATVASYAATGLLVLGRSHEHPAIGALHRSLAQRVVASADCPVAVVPADHDG